MTQNRHILGWWVLTIVLVAGIGLGTHIAIRSYRRHHRPLQIVGAVIAQSIDTRRQTPIANVEVISKDGLSTGPAKSDFTGLFILTMRPGVKTGQRVELAFRHPDYQSVDADEVLNGDMYVVRMIPVHGEVEEKLNGTEIGVSNVLVEYSTEISRTENIGSAAKTLQIINTSNVPCNHRDPCSPDGKWKAEIGSASIDAGQGNVFRDARVTCIAGPCPFTRIDNNSLDHDDRTMSVKVRNWSDTTTFLLQAEVFRPQLENVVRQIYPAIFGRSMSFALPASAVGPSIQADLNGTPLVFPLGPTPIMSWADCQLHLEKNQVKNYRCELRAGYGFR